MGLDAVEIIMEAEDRFKIRVRDEDAGAIRTVEEFARSIWMVLRPEGPPCATQRSFYQVRRLILEEGGVDRVAIRPDTPFSSLIDRADEARYWRSLRSKRVSMPALELREEDGVRCAVFCGMCATFGGALALGFLKIVGTADPWIALIATAVAIAVFCVGATLYTSRRGGIPEGCETVGALARRTAPVYTRPMLVDDGLTYESVLLEVRKITAEQMAFDIEEVKPESRFYQDLGVS